MANSKSGWTLYLMIHLPFFWWWKIGITGKTAKERAKQLDRATIGRPFVVMAVPIPGAYLIEQDLHRRLSWFNCRWHRGDGGTEYFWFPVALVVLPFMVAVWMGYIWLLDLIFGTRIFEFIVGVVLVIV